MAKLYVMIGVAGSGKSSWILSHINYQHDMHISRDDIRFSMVSEDQPYFSKEKEVYNEFIKQINDSLNAGYNVFADATHLSRASRNKLLTRISAKVEEVDCIWLHTTLDETIERNDKRRNTRAYVDPDIIRSMFYNLEFPDFNEGFTNIYIVSNNSSIRVLTMEGDDFYE